MSSSDSESSVSSDSESSEGGGGGFFGAVCLAGMFEESEWETESDEEVDSSECDSERVYTSVWADLLEDKPEQKFPLRPSLASSAPDNGYVEPVLVDSASGLLPNSIRDALVVEMVGLAHNADTNKAAYTLLKKIVHLGNFYRKVVGVSALSTE
jgi:hypothetical protein